MGEPNSISVEKENILAFVPPLYIHIYIYILPGLFHFRIPHPSIYVIHKIKLFDRATDIKKKKKSYVSYKV